MSEAQIASVRTGCADALQALLQVQRVEAVTRVNRGYEYEGVLRLLAAFNSRAALNKLDVAPLVTATSHIQAKFSDFQKHYLLYADQVDDVLDVNCKQAPVTFYDKLTLAREARAQIATDIRDIEMLLDEYQAGVQALSDRLQGGGVAQ